MYCKSCIKFVNVSCLGVLIVAKCIVNEKEKWDILGRLGVLIVAKCIVNQDVIDLNVAGLDVLIVAKCIVNSSNTNIFCSRSSY